MSIFAITAFPLRARADSDEELARAHFKTGQIYYEQSDYTGALHEFSESYRIGRRPELLFNIAVCEERLGQNARAIASYELYLKELPAAADAERVRARIAYLKSSQPPPEPPRVRELPALAVAAPPPPPAPAAAPPRRKRGGLIAGLVVGGVLVGVALGVGLGVGLNPSPNVTSTTLGTVEATK